MGAPFRPCSMHEPLIVLIFLPLYRLSNYRGPWVIRGSPQALDVQDHLEAGSKHPELHGCRKFHDLEGPAHGVRYYKEEWSRYLLFKLIEAQNPPPVSCGLVRRILMPSPRGSLSSRDKSYLQRQQKQIPGDGGTPQQALPDIKRGRSIEWESYLNVICASLET